MDLSQSGQNFVTGYGDAMTALRTQDENTRNYINARKERAMRDGQQAPDDTQQVAASGTPGGVPLPDSPNAAQAAPAAPSVNPLNLAPGGGNAGARARIAKLTGGTQNYADTPEGQQSALANLKAQAAAYDQSPQGKIDSRLNTVGAINDVGNVPARLVSNAGTAVSNGVGAVGNMIAGRPVYNEDSPYQPLLQTPSQNPEQQARLEKIRALEASTKNNVTGTRPAEPPPVDGRGGSNPSVAARNNNPGNLVFAGQTGATPSPQANPDGSHFAVFQDPQAGAAAAQQQLLLDIGRGNNTVQGLVHKWAGSQYQGNSPASEQNYVARVSQALGVSPTTPLTPAHVPAMAQAMFRVESGGAPAQTAAPQQQAQPQQPPQTQGPTFTAANGTSFTLPTAYSDGMVQQAQQQLVQAKNAMQLAWMRYQNGSAPDLTAVQAAQGQIQHLQQGLYNADIYAKTQQAQGGNPQAFSALLNEYSNKVGQPVQIVPVGNGQYALKAKGGQLIDQGDPAHIAGTLGGVLNSDARAMNMKIQMTYAEESAKARAQEDAKVPVEIAKLQNALRIKLSENDNALLKQALENQKPIMLALSGGQSVVYNPADKNSPFSIADPNRQTPTGGTRVDRPLVKQ